jgi:hypothetical protein
MSSQYDALIDETARAMTDVQPSSEFHQRVVGNLRPTAGRTAWRAAGALAAAATVIVALGLPHKPSAPAHTPTPLVSAPSLPPEAPNNAARVGATVRTARKALPAISADEIAWLSRSVPAIESAPDIVIDPIQPSRPSIAPISVEPVGPKPLEIAPLDVRSGGRQ